MYQYLLGIDIGTSGCKCCLIDFEGNVIGNASREYNPLSPKAGWVEQDPSDWYRAVFHTLGKLQKTTGIDPDQVAAVGTTGQMRGITFIDSAGKVVRNSILWNDLRCEKEVEDIRKGAGDIVENVTRNPLNTMCSLPKLLWVMRHEPETWNRTAKLIFPKDYLNYRLTGNLQTDYSDASGSSFYDIEEQTWSEEILKTFSLLKNKLPHIYPSTMVIGEVSAQAAQELGLSQGTPVVAGGSDATVEMLALGIQNAKQCKIRLGTSGALSTVVESLNSSVNRKLYCWSYLAPDKWMVDINTRSCAQATVWLRDIFYHEKPQTEGSYWDIEQEAVGAPPGSEGLFFHPYLLGEDAPYWDPKLRGSFFGCTVSHKRSHFARAVLEGTAYALRDARSVFGEIAEGFSEYIFVGGGVKNALWLRIVADVLGINGMVFSCADASLGAAMLAGIGKGVFKDFNEAIKRCRRVDKTVHHSPKNHRLYSELFEQYKELKIVFDKVYEKRRKNVR